MPISPFFNVVLIAPEIPQNTGNIARTCAAAGARLHLVRPLGFILSDRRLRRAGADYWSGLDLAVHESLEAFFRETPPERCLFFSQKAPRLFSEMPVEESVFLVFGRESTGLPEEILAACRERSFRVPMRPGARSLNVSNAAAVVLYEALRRRGYSGLI
ncbi:MAG TPA: tRNA (cytidine(34)-2'-O)-methyltransferase [Candidatus Aminicenantes bacterium]|nr:tRNA (cytidine(34)-2'-O)-methyltransferase [Candidatus Aminicenantes bacterium]HNT31627.1 tRNA (cytidine(34)-2'-O)-methyltransferase [Candidatus Aminicenantes bacterium]HOS11805.1 tRNA (cytidine(34)-2'-O)-methyltransferase [Candidatus Aminicenantes bacterium]HOY97969.1 tRNA (cytidine(34)-2'-O)-methyltransferase [Candidatus Aminicenantes bacterium]HPN16010.1 tRNA (cytidine(34)-2'-O)-methyltransferase [Candidatus Aminicenantes bacterium]